MKVQKKSQSSMEYLLTYGWGILIVGIAFGVIFSLGVFNPNYFSPKATTGSCRIVRPFGVGTSKGVSLSGLCNNEMPQYVVQQTGSASIAVTNTISFSTMTFSIWIRSYTTDWNDYMYYASNGIFVGTGNTVTGKRSGAAYFYMTNGGTTRNLGGAGANAVISDGNWHNLIITYDGSTEHDYIDGVDRYAHNYGSYLALPTSSTSLYFGFFSHLWSGNFSDIELYNVALPYNSVQQVYHSGIGGVPIDYANLLGWWPLNGDTNDYSGNGANGVPTNALFINNWWSTYSPP